MWSRTSTKLRATRLATGGVIAGACVILPFTLDGPGNPIAMVGHVSDIAVGVFDDSRRFLPIDFGDIDPASLRTDGDSSLSGTVVYAEGPGGAAIIIGSIVSRSDGYAIALRPDQADLYRGKADLLYARPVVDVREAIDLVCAPGGAETELAYARDSLMPIIQRELLTPLETKLRAEIELMLKELPEKHGDDIDALVEGLRVELAPEIGQLSESLAGAAWDEIGVWGVAEGAGRKTLNAGEAAWDWTKETVGGIFGSEKSSDSSTVKRRPRDFLSDDRKDKISSAVLAEAKRFWVANQDVILEKAGKALQKHESTFMRKVEDEWLPRLYDRVVVATWEGHGSVVEDALSAFARDFANRRLTTPTGAPTLALAYSVRSATLITERPLFVLQLREVTPIEAPATITSGDPANPDAEAAPTPEPSNRVGLLPYAKHRRPS